MVTVLYTVGTYVGVQGMGGREILTAAWRGSKFEIQSVLREVCDAVLDNKKVPLAKRLEERGERGGRIQQPSVGFLRRPGLWWRPVS